MLGMQGWGCAQVTGALTLMAPTKQWGHIPGEFYSMQPAFPPLASAEQVHFPAFSTNVGSVNMKGQRARF